MISPYVRRLRLGAYDQLYARLRDASLPPIDSLDLLTKASTEL